MLKELVKDKVYYKIFDKSYPDNNFTHAYNTHRNDYKIHSIEKIESNINTVLKNFESTKILLLNQVHGNKVICPDDDLNYNFGLQLEGDASVTTEKNVVLGIRTADCVPVLLTSEDGKVIGAAHCGWRGAKLDIVANLANKMKMLGASNIIAVMGPSIAQTSYEVSQDYYNDFVTESIAYQKFFTPSKKAQHYMFDLVAFVRKKLEDTDIKIAVHIDDDTYTMADKYPSYRRSTHTGEIYEQNILSAIIIK